MIQIVASSVPITLCQCRNPESSLAFSGCPCCNLLCPVSPSALRWALGPRFPNESLGLDSYGNLLVYSLFLYHALNVSTQSTCMQTLLRGLGIPGLDFTSFLLPCGLQGNPLYEAGVEPILCDSRGQTLDLSFHLRQGLCQVCSTTTLLKVCSALSAAIVITSVSR